MRIRRMLIGTATTITAVVGALLMAPATPAAAVGPALLPFNVTNNSGRGDAVHLYVLGVMNGRLGYVNAAGAFNPWPAGGLPPTPAPDVSIAGPGNGGSKAVQVPRGLSGRIYFSFGSKLDFRLTPDGLVQPAPWAGGDPNRDILFDWSEFTYNDSGLWLNSSQVDMFAVPHTVSVSSAAGTRSTGTVVANGRANIINAIKAQPGWAGSVYTRADGTVLRVLAPGKAAEAGNLSTTYLDSYITSAWNAYSSKTLTVMPFGDQPNIKYFGRTSGNVMNFTNSSGAQVASYSKPSSANVWGCDGNLHAPNDQVIGPIARTLCAALNRGTLGTIDTQPSTNPAAFYQSNPTNQYSKIIHANMLDGKAYGFAFDDVGAFESLVHDGDPRSAGITLDSFTGGGTQPPASGTSRIVSDWNAKCIDVNGANFADGVRLQVWTCNPTNAQQWAFTGGSVKTQNNKCMDAAGAGTANGTPIQIANCSGNTAQQFVLGSAGTLVNPQSNRCVDIKDWNTADGAQLQLWDCNSGANQKWHAG
jgi:hypothetical protein